MTSWNGAAFTFHGMSTVSKDFWPKNAKTSPPPPNLVNILLPDPAFTYMCPDKGKIRDRSRNLNRFKRARDVGRGLSAPRHFSLQTPLRENNPSRKTLKTVSDRKMHNNVHNMLQLPEKGGNPGSIFLYYLQPIPWQINIDHIHVDALSLPLLWGVILKKS